ncbi:sensor histidine kinase [Amycolatopsis taiwanensis]|uniref:sensor histidine kinase n=1 Tax=Amycolatopsis taiwanensis TaxID=342230 RepID=UPI0025522511|nr:ATP-binding protein [Amycolatopsis taiwanensis]
MRIHVSPKFTTVRARLTALYAGLFIATTTTVMVAVNLLLERIVGPPGLPKGGDLIPPSGGFIAPDGHDVPQKAVEIAVHQYQWTVTWVAATALAVIGAFAGWWLAGRALRPVHHITETAKRLSLSTLHERIALDGPRDELRELADTFDAMLDRLERAADNQRRFAANASHELRTPLAIQRAAIEIGLENPSQEQLARMRGELLEANLRTERLIESLLTLAQGERSPDNPELLDLAAVAHDAAEQHEALATTAGVTIDLDLRSVPAMGDSVMLTRLIGNLIHNGIRYNHPGGRVGVRTSPDAGVVVTNTGPPVPAERLPELFEPFRRLHAPRVGTGRSAGLGLSIVSAIAEAHRAVVDARANADGGLAITVRLPAVPASAPPTTPRPVRAGR